jgi:hypothetical protein
MVLNSVGMKSAWAKLLEILQCSQTLLSVGVLVQSMDGLLKSKNCHAPGIFSTMVILHHTSVEKVSLGNKRILFRNINSRCAEHDSTAFKNSKFYKWLEQNWKKLAEKSSISLAILHM